MTKKAGPAENYTFDFKKEVEQAFEDFPKLQSNTVFVNAAINPLEIFYGSERAATHKDLYDALGIASLWIETIGGSVSAYFGGMKVIVFDPRDLMVLSDLDADHAYALDHEMGHVLVRKAQTGENPYKENAADAFAAIRHIQRFGNDPYMLSLLSCSRGFESVHSGDISHLTTPTVNQIIRDSRHIDFSTLTPAETIKAAAAYARKFTPSAAEIAEVNNLSASLHKKNRTIKSQVKLIASTALSTSDRFTFEIGLSVFQPFLHPDGVMQNEKHIKFADETRKKFREEFIKRAQHFGLEDIAEELQENKADICTPAPSAKTVNPKRIPKYGQPSA